MLYEVCGIKLHPGKEGLVKARLMKRLKALQISNFEDYLDYVEKDKAGEELVQLIDCLTTNKTDFFREPHHFDFLEKDILPQFQNVTRPVRIWSAGCSSGEEPYTLGIYLLQAFPRINQMDVKILATDISTKVLAEAKQGIYAKDQMADVPETLIEKYFHPATGAGENSYQVNKTIQNLISFARLNLMENWPMRGPFDLILCRNVMIYFDQPTRQQLVHRFWQILRPGGYLFVGHSESLTSWSQEFKYVQPAIYQK